MANESICVKDPIRVFLVEDHRIVLWCLQRLIERSAPLMRVVGAAASMGDAMARLPEARPDVIVLDLNLGEHDATEALPALVSTTKARVLVLTACNDEKVHARAVMLGARGVVTKGESGEMVLAAIERVHAGETWISRSLFSNVFRTMLDGPPSQHKAEAEQIGRLTRREREIIAAAVEDRGECSQVIADRLHITEQTLRNQLSIIYRKLGIRGRTALCAYATKHGLASAESSMDARSRASDGAMRSVSRANPRAAHAVQLTSAAAT